MIHVVGSILSGNLGDCWRNANDAANALAEFTTNVWTKDLYDHGILHENFSIDLKILYNTCGYHSPVYALNDSGQDVTYFLTDEETIWSKFCESEIAEKLSNPLS